MPSTATTTNLPGATSAPDKLALLLAVVVEVLATSSIFTALGLSPDAAAAMMAGLMGAAAVLRMKLSAIRSWIDVVAVVLCAAVEGMAIAGVFDGIGLTADGVAHVFGLILAVAAAVRWKGAAVAGKPVEAVLFVAATGLIAMACVKQPTVAQSVNAAEAAAAGVSVAIADLKSDEAAKAREALDNVREALEVLDDVAPAIDDELAKREAASK